MKSRGFTILETLVVCAIIGFIAAIAIPMYMNSQNRAKQSRTIGNIRTIASAWESRGAEVKAYNAAGVNFAIPTVNVTAAQMTTMLTPTYIRELPARDGWGWPFDFKLTSAIGNRAPAITYSIRSMGRDGKLEAAGKTNYRIQATTNLDCDIVYSNGTFIAYPQGKQNIK